MVWARIDDQFPDHPKVAAAGPLAGWLHVCAICYSSRMLTDGFIPKGQVRKLADIENVTEVVTALLTAGLWHESPGGYMVHDYLEYNPSAEEVRAQRAENAKRQAEWRERHKNRPSNDERNGVTDSVTNTRPVPVPVPVPNVSPKDSLSRSSVPTQASEPAEPKQRSKRAYAHDSEEYRLSRLLSARIRENNPSARAPSEAVLQRWSDDVRKMREIDGRSLEDIRAIVLWSQHDPFWFANVLSMGKVRDDFDKLTAHRIRQEREGTHERTNGQPTRPIPEYVTNEWRAPEKRGA